ncbi:DUF3298 and DUF4163 domain-containing protein [Sporosalibacterium faouarense]|uniref:DUF3298 and DUF4163 domain-containing protein n=1 Tax=Sporosalibacterium faouarense TaxID=516123 RepID=UPI00141CEE9D|nr:DUF3298 and DUF4163 domain-containing protein [Sporosalibacterium faouarense]MTI49286.1 DUF3298 and DUF4163 domain-containing protein [Bacillota bacterium]
MLTLPVYIKTNSYFTPTVNMYYPFVYGLEDPSVQKHINYNIQNMMYKLIAELRQPDMITYITGSYEIKNNQRNVLSLTLNGLGDFHGAHPVTIVKSLTADTRTGEIYQLSELFKKGSDYVKVLSDMIAKQIKERDIPLLGEFKGIKPNQDYYIADKGLVIYFQQVEISPYYVGFPYFLIPIYDIQDLIPEDGILNRMIPFV